MALNQFREISNDHPDTCVSDQQRERDQRQPERRAIVNQCLALLNERQRKIIELIHFEGYTLGEAAALSGESLANGRNLYYRGMKALRSHLIPKETAAIGTFRAKIGMTRSNSA